MKYNSYRNKPDIISGLFRLLPIAIIIMLFIYIKKQGGISNILKSLLGSDPLTGAINSVLPSGQQNNSTTQIQNHNTVKQNFDTKKITSTHREKANQLFILFNDFTFWTNFGSSILPKDKQKQILAIIKNNPYILDRAAIYVAYGTPKLNNRQSNWLGFIWDETTNTLLGHAERFMDGYEKTETIKYLNGAIKAYL